MQHEYLPATTSEIDSFSSDDNGGSKRPAGSLDPIKPCLHIERARWFLVLKPKAEKPFRKTPGAKIKQPRQRGGFSSAATGLASLSTL